MHPNAWTTRSLASRLALAIVFGLALTPSAHAQWGGSWAPSWPAAFAPPVPASPAAPTQAPAGTLLTVPLVDFGTIVAQNTLRQNQVNLLQVSQMAIGDTNTQVATVSIRQKNTLEPAKICWLPAWSLGWVEQANKNKTIIEQTVIGSGNTQVAQVEVHQDNDAVVPKGTRFVLAPLWAVAPIQALNQQNVNVVHIAQLAVGDNNSQVALLAVDQQNASRLQVPAAAARPLIQLNLNLIVINQVAVGNGNTQVVTVNVGQDGRI